MPKASTRTSSKRTKKPAREGLDTGDFVTNPLKPDWGPGRVAGVKRGIVFVYFRDRPGKDVIRMKENGLVAAEPDAVLEALPDFVEKDAGYALPRVTKRKVSAKKRRADIADSFASFVDEKVRPHLEANPNWKRLDGETTGSNDDVFGSFRYQGAAYRIHSDTHFEPIFVAYQAMQAGDEEPFVESATKSGARLDLTPDLAAKVTGKSRHMYAYGASKV